MKRAALLTALLLSAPAQAGTDIGSDLFRDADPGLANPGGICAPVCTLSQRSLTGATTATPAGVLVSWSVRTNTVVPAGGVALRILRPAPADPNYRGQATVLSPVETTAGAVTTFPAQIPVAAGDLIGLDFAVAGGASVLAGGPGEPAVGEVIAFAIPPVDGDVEQPSGLFEAPPTELLLQARVEPDANGNGLGDETQEPFQPAPQNVPADSTVTPPVPATGATVQPPVAPAARPGTRPARRGRTCKSRAKKRGSKRSRLERKLESGMGKTKRCAKKKKRSKRRR